MNTLRFVFILIVVLMASARFAMGQDIKPCDHTSNSAKRFDAIRLLPPVKIRAFNGLTIETTFEDSKSITAVSFDISKETVRPGDFGKTFNQGYWWVMYSICDSHVYVVTPVLDKQFK
jgi:hypothetical protein